jgi:hypothetical protein
MILPALFLATAATASTSFDLRPLSTAETKLIQAAVADKLIDPSSPMFKMYPLSAKGDKYCGEVNAKNRFGGYTGYTVFTIFIDRDAKGKVTGVFHPSIDGKDDTLIAMLMRSRCMTDGYDVPKF